MTEVFHLDLTRDMLGGATMAIVPGDPARPESIAKGMDNPVFLASKREFTSWLGYINGTPVVVCSTGIGGPSTSIAVEELAQLGVRTFLRVGTTGAIQPDIGVGDVVVTQAAVRLDGASGVAVIGAGPVGVSAALLAARAPHSKNVILIDAPRNSGALMNEATGEDLSIGGPTGLFSKALRDAGKTISVSSLKGMGLRDDR